MGPCGGAVLLAWVLVGAGSDTSGNGTSVNPWGSIAWSIKQANDVTLSYHIHVAAGTYNGNFNDPCGPMPPGPHTVGCGYANVDNKNLIIEGAGMATTIWDAKLNTPHLNGKVGNITLTLKHMQFLHGFAWGNVGWHGGALQVVAPKGPVKLTIGNVEFKHCGAGAMEPGSGATCTCGSTCSDPSTVVGVCGAGAGCANVPYASQTAACKRCCVNTCTGQKLAYDTCFNSMGATCPATCAMGTTAGYTTKLLACVSAGCNASIPYTSQTAACKTCAYDKCQQSEGAAGYCGWISGAANPAAGLYGCNVCPYKNSGGCRPDGPGGYGGAIFLQVGAGSSPGFTKISNSVFTRNKGQGRAGAYYVSTVNKAWGFSFDATQRHDSTLTNNLFSSNTAGMVGTRGGHIFFGALGSPIDFTLDGANATGGGAYEGSFLMTRGIGKGGLLHVNNVRVQQSGHRTGSAFMSYQGALYVYWTSNPVIPTQTCGGPPAFAGCRDTFTQVKVTNSMFYQNVATVGGGMQIFEAQSMQVDNTQFIQNIVSTNGGGIALQHKGYGFDSRFFCPLVPPGGGYDDNLCKSKVTNSKFTQNVAYSGGGGIYTAADGFMNMGANTFLQNAAKVQGGAMHINGGSWNFPATDSNSKFIGNTAGYPNLVQAFGFYPAGLQNYVSATSDIRADDAYRCEQAKQDYPGFTSCNGMGASLSGAVQLGPTAKLTFQSCSFDNNKGLYMNGAMGIAPTAVVAIHDSNFSNNEAGCSIGGDAGAIGQMGGVRTPDQDQVPACHFGSVAFACMIACGCPKCLCKGTWIKDCTFTGNKNKGIASEGGVIKAFGGSLTTIESATFTNNQADLGGVIYNSGTVRTLRCTFTGNKATTPVVLLGGGAILMLASSKLYDTGSVLANNTASLSSGGGILLSVFSSAEFSGTRFTGNQAVFGGNLQLDATSQATFQADAIIELGVVSAITLGTADSTASCSGGVPPNTTIGGVGAGIHVLEKAVVRLNDTLLQGNKATSGSAIFCDGCTITVGNGTVLKDNAAKMFGGGFFFTKHPNTTMRFDRFYCTQNQASVGGCVYWDDKKVKGGMEQCDPPVGKSACWLNNKAVPASAGKPPSGAYGPDVATDVKQIVPVHAVTYRANKSADYPPGTVSSTALGGEEPNQYPLALPLFTNPTDCDCFEQPAQAILQVTSTRRGLLSNASSNASAKNTEAATTGTTSSNAPIASCQYKCVRERDLQTALTKVPHKIEYRPGVMQDVYFQLRDFFGQVATEATKGSGVLVKLQLPRKNSASVPVSNLNVGADGVAVSSLGLVLIPRMEVGGKLGAINPWNTTATWFRPDYVPGNVLRYDAEVIMQATAVSCIPGEKTVYSFDALRIKQGIETGKSWSQATPEACQCIEKGKEWVEATQFGTKAHCVDSVLPLPISETCGVKACVWCQSGTYSVDLSSTTCLDCAEAVLPTHFRGKDKKIYGKMRASKAAICADGGAYIYPQKNYWRHYAPSDFIYKCPKPGACLGGKANVTTCAEGYGGPLCAVCDQESSPRFAQSGKRCKKCSGIQMDGDAISLIVIVVFMLFVVGKIAYDSICGDTKIKGTAALKIMMKKKKIAARAKAIVGQVKVLIAYFQALCAFIAGGDAVFPVSYTQLLDSFEFVNVDVLSILRGMCLIPHISYYGIFLFNFITPIVISILLMIHYCITKPRGQAAEEPEAKGFGAFHWNLFCTICFMIYPNECRINLGIFRCHELQYSATESRSFLYADYALECYQGEYWIYLALGIIGTLLYVIGIPAFFALTLYRYTLVTVDGAPAGDDPGATLMLHDPIVEEKFGFMYARFRTEYWWYETSEMVRKMFMGGVGMFIAPGTATNIIAALAINTFFMIMELTCWPFKTYDDNMLMAISLIATSVTLLGALLVNAQIDMLDNYPEGLSRGLLIGTTVVLILLYLAMLIRFQLPFICTWLCPDFISKSPLNCYRPGGICGPPKAPSQPVAADELDEEDELEKKENGIEMQHLTYPVEPDIEEEEVDALIETYFHRYDLDESGTLNTSEELQQLTTNLSFKLRLPLTGEEIDRIVDSAGELTDLNCWSLDEFRDWFKEEFVYGKPTDLRGDAAMAISLAQDANMNQNLMGGMGGDGGD